MLHTLYVFSPPASTRYPPSFCGNQLTADLGDSVSMRTLTLSFSLEGLVLRFVLRWSTVGVGCLLAGQVTTG